MSPWEFGTMNYHGPGNLEWDNDEGRALGIWEGAGGTPLGTTLETLVADSVRALKFDGEEEEPDGTELIAAVKNSW